jgi:hypothetical protein
MQGAYLSRLTLCDPQISNSNNKYTDPILVHNAYFINKLLPQQVILVNNRTFHNPPLKQYEYQWVNTWKMSPIYIYCDIFSFVIFSRNVI